MQWISLLSKAPRRVAALLLAALLLVSIWQSPLHSAEEKKLSVYSPQATYALQVIEHDNFEYAGVYELLQPLGKIQTRVDGNGYHLRVRDVEGVFTEGKSKITIGRTEITMPSKVVIDQGRVLVPIRVLPTVLAKYLNLHSELHETARRLFIENTALRFSTDFKRSDLVLSFPAAVNPTVSTESGKVHLLFTREPVVFGAESISYSDRLISSINFAERNGTAEVVVSGSSPLLATFGDGGKTITISAAPAPATAQSQTPPAQTSGNTTVVSGLIPASGTASASPAQAIQTMTPRPGNPAGSVVRFFVMIDAGHGGDETGARFSDKLAEKDITLAMARRLKTELQNRGVAAVLLRDADSSITLDQRAVTSNSQRASLYVSIHAGGPGTGVRVYTSLMPAPDLKRKGEKLGPFVPWESAQASFLERSRLVAGGVVAEMGSKDVNASMATAPVPPLNSIAAPAIAVEIAPPVADSKPDALSATGYQQTIAAALATAIVNIRPKIEEPR